MEVKFDNYSRLRTGEDWFDFVAGWKKDCMSCVLCDNCIGIICRL